MILHIILNNQLGTRFIIFLFPLHTLIFLIALLINYQFMPHPEPDDKCEKKYWLKVLALNQNHFGKKNWHFFVTFKKSKRFFLSVQLILSPIWKLWKSPWLLPAPHPFLILANFFPASKKNEKPVFKKNITKLIRNSYINVEKLSCGVASCCMLFKGSLWKRSYLNCYFICKIAI